MEQERVSQADMIAAAAAAVAELGLEFSDSDSDEEESDECDDNEKIDQGSNDDDDDEEEECPPLSFESNDILYGREEEMQMIKEAHEGLVKRATSSEDNDSKEEMTVGRRRESEVILIRGEEEGVGCSALLEKLQRSFSAESFVLRGRFDEHCNFHCSACTADCSSAAIEDHHDFHLPDVLSSFLFRHSQPQNQLSFKSIVLLIDDLHFAHPRSLQTIVQTLAATHNVNASTNNTSHGSDADNDDDAPSEDNDTADHAHDDEDMHKHKIDAGRIEVSSNNADDINNTNGQTDNNHHASSTQGKQTNIHNNHDLSTLPITFIGTYLDQTNNQSTNTSTAIRTTAPQQIANQLQELNIPPPTTLTLSNLSFEVLHTMITIYLSTPPNTKPWQTTTVPMQRKFKELATLIHHYTQGNPKQVHSFLKQLIRDETLTYCTSSSSSLTSYTSTTPRIILEGGKWVWNVEEIRSLVIQHLSQKIVNLNEDGEGTMKRVLIIASFLGVEFEHELLQMALPDYDDNYISVGDCHRDDDDKLENCTTDNRNEYLHGYNGAADSFKCLSAEYQVSHPIYPPKDEKNEVDVADNMEPPKTKSRTKKQKMKKKWQKTTLSIVSPSKLVSLSLTSNNNNNSNSNNNNPAAAEEEEQKEKSNPSSSSSETRRRRRKVKIIPRQIKSDRKSRNDQNDNNCCHSLKNNHEGNLRHSIELMETTTTTTTNTTTTMTMIKSIDSKEEKQQQQQEERMFPNIVRNNAHPFPNIAYNKEETKTEEGLVPVEQRYNSNNNNNNNYSNHAKKEDALSEIINTAVREGILDVDTSKTISSRKGTGTAAGGQNESMVRSESWSSLKSQSSFGFHLPIPGFKSRLESYSEHDMAASATAAAAAATTAIRIPTKLVRNTSIPGIKYKFMDKQIRDVLYSLVPSEEREDMHRRIGKSLLENGIVQGRLERSYLLFATVDQMNMGVPQPSSSSFVYDFDQKIVLADLNFRAARRASDKSMFDRATSYANAGIELIHGNNKTEEEDAVQRRCWKEKYNLSLQLHTQCASLAYFNGDFDEVERLEKIVSKHAQSPVDSLQSCVALINSLNARTKYEDALEVGYSYLSQLGCKMHRKSIRRVRLVSELFRLKVMLRNKTEECILNLPQMESGTKYTAVMEIFNAMLIPAYFEKRDIALLIVLRMVRLSLSRGICGLSAVAFAAYGKGLAYTLSDFDGACQYGQIALAIVKKVGGQDLLPRVLWMVYGYIHHWKNHIQMSLDDLFNGYQMGLKNGATACAFLSAQEYCILYFHAGLPLEPIEKDMRMFVDQIVEFKQDFAKTTFLLLWQSILNLMRHQPWENDKDRLCLTGEAMDEKELIETINHDHTTSIMYHCKMWLAYYFGDYEFAAKMMQLAKGYEKQTNGHFTVCKHRFFVGLISLAMARKTSLPLWKVRARKVIKKLEHWTGEKAVNCLHLLFLLQAEYASLEEERDQVQKLYDKAIATASKHGFYQDKALAYERAGVYFFEQNDTHRAEHYIRSAHEAYTCWGAQAKADHLRYNFSVFLRRRRMSTGMSSIRGRSRLNINNINNDPRSSFAGRKTKSM